MPAEHPRYRLFCAGSSYIVDGSDISAGWGFVIIDTDGDRVLTRRHHSRRRLNITCDTMVLVAVLKGLRAFKELRLSTDEIAVCSASDYLISGAITWAPWYKSQQWLYESGDPIADATLWQDLDYVTGQMSVQWKHYPGSHWGVAMARGEAGALLNPVEI